MAKDNGRRRDLMIVAPRAGPALYPADSDRSRVESRVEGRWQPGPTLLVFDCLESPWHDPLLRNLEWLVGQHPVTLELVAIDVWEDSRCAIQYEIVTVPTLVLVVAGKEMARVTGHCSKRRLARRVLAVLDRSRTPDAPRRDVGSSPGLPTDRRRMVDRRRVDRPKGPTATGGRENV